MDSDVRVIRNAARLRDTRRGERSIVDPPSAPHFAFRIVPSSLKLIGQRSYAVCAAARGRGGPGRFANNKPEVPFEAATSPKWEGRRAKPAGFQGHVCC